MTVNLKWKGKVKKTEEEKETKKKIKKKKKGGGGDRNSCLQTRKEAGCEKHVA